MVLLSVGQFSTTTVVKCKPDLIDMLGLMQFKKSSDFEKSGIQVSNKSCRAIQSSKFKTDDYIVDGHLDTYVI